MNSKSTWVWITIAAVLLAAVVGVEKFWRQEPPGLVALLPGFKAADVTSVQYIPAGQLEIRADRTNRIWQLVKPITFPAQSASIDALVTVLQQLAPVQTIAGAELRQRPNADEEFGFNNRSTLSLVSGADRRQLYLGSRTAPGDGVYVQIVGVEGVFVVDSQLLKLLPAKSDDWRDTGLVDLRGQVLDHITVSNANNLIQLQQATTNELWRLTAPMSARADNLRLVDAMQKLHTTRVVQFVTDAPSDLEAFGLHTPELALTLARGTNILSGLVFGKSPTNDSTLIYVRRAGSPSVLTVEREPLRPWLAPLNEFRDPHLVTLVRQPDEVQVTGTDSFTLLRGTNAWRLADSELPVDAGFVGEFLLPLVKAPIQQFKDTVTAEELPQYGLTEPVRRITLRGGATDTATNTVLADVTFGTPTNGTVYVQRADENTAVYAIKIEDYARMAVAGWQLRDRQVWRFAPTNAVRIVLQRGARRSELRRTGAASWMFAGGSQGVVTGSEVEKTVTQFSALDAGAWLARGEAARSDYGFNTNSLQVTLELRDGTKHEVEFGAEAADGYPAAAVKLNGETWIFEFPVIPYQYLKMTLLNPAAFPP